jgi:uncharacterized protein with von Willebrand factor type A (vWA) domain
MLSADAPPLALRAGERLAGFAGFLRANGFGVGAGEAVQVLYVARRVGVLDAQRLRWSLKALLCGRGDEWRRFDALFDAWFLPPNRWAAPEPRSVEAGRGAVPVEARGGAPHDRDDAIEQRHAASPQAQLARTDFRELTAREHTLAIETLMRRFARRMRRLRLRREARSRQGRRVDLRSTIRRSVASGGAPLRLCWKEHRRVRPRLVLLLDVSRSMSAYGFFYLRLARALGGELADVHSFIFHTHVIPVTDALRDPDPWRAQERLHLIALGWGGGTRIGDSIAQFNREHAPRLVHSRTAVLVLSDGYDTGDPQGLADALVQLRRRARRVVWLNPLSVRVGAGPGCAGMQAALPHLDLLAPGANLAAIAAVLPDLLEVLS